MPRKIPIEAVKDLAKEYGLQQVILLAWDEKLTHVVTYGKNVEDCAGVADVGNKIKDYLGWPESLKQDPSKVEKLKARIKKLEETLEVARERLHIRKGPKCPSCECAGGVVQEQNSELGVVERTRYCPECSESYKTEIVYGGEERTVEQDNLGEVAELARR